MKKITVVLSLFAMSLFMVACGATDKNETPNNDPVVKDSNDQTTNDADQAENLGVEGEADTETTNRDDSNADDKAAKMEQLDFIDFDLSVEYENDEEYEAELELKQDNRVEAEIEDDLNGEKLKGREAFDKLFPLVEKLTITQDTSKEEAIEEVLNVFQLDDGYQEFKLEIKFKDDTKIKFEDKK